MGFRLPWRHRRSTRVGRWSWGLIYLAGYLLWAWVVHNWATAHHYGALLSGPKPLYLGVAAMTYFPLAILSWHVMYPGDPRIFPWAKPDE